MTACKAGAGAQEIYESGVAPAKRGTYLGVIERIPCLQELGITAVELLPVFQFDAQNALPGRVAGVLRFWKS